MKTCFPAMKGRRLGRRGYLLGDVMLVTILLGTLISGFISLSTGQGKFRERYLLSAGEGYPQRQFVWIVYEEESHGE